MQFLNVIESFENHLEGLELSNCGLRNGLAQVI